MFHNVHPIYVTDQSQRVHGSLRRGRSVSVLTKRIFFTHTGKMEMHIVITEAVVQYKLFQSNHHQALQGIGYQW